MKDALTIWILLKIHKQGLCRVFHTKETGTHFKGWCPIAQWAWDIANPQQEYRQVSPRPPMPEVEEL